MVTNNLISDPMEVMVAVVNKRIMSPNLYLFLIYQGEIGCWLVVISPVNVGYACANWDSCFFVVAEFM